MITISLNHYLSLLIMFIILSIYHFYMLILMIAGRIDRKTAKRWKTICKIQKISPTKSIKILIRKFVDDYSAEHNIEWK